MIKDLINLDDKQLEQLAKDLSLKDEKTQLKTVDDVAKYSLVNAVKLTIYTIEILKESSKQTNEDNTKFLAMCDKGIDELKSLISDGELSKEERIDATDKIHEILIMANESNKRTERHRTRNNVIIGAAAGVGAASLLTALVAAISKSIKK